MVMGEWSRRTRLEWRRWWARNPGTVDRNILFNILISSSLVASLLLLTSDKKEKTERKFQKYTKFKSDSCYPPTTRIWNLTVEKRKDKIPRRDLGGNYFKGNVFQGLEIKIFFGIVWLGERGADRFTDLNLVLILQLI